MNAGTFRRWLYCALQGVVGVLVALPAAGWTDKPVRFVVLAPPGSSADLAARAVATQVAATIKQPVVVENVASASDANAIQAVAGALPDGQTLFIGSATGPGVDSLRELRPVAQIARSKSEPGAWLGAMASAKTPADLVARINGAIVHSCGTAGVLERLGTLGFAPGLPLTPGQLERSSRALPG